MYRSKAAKRELVMTIDARSSAATTVSTLNLNACAIFRIC